jgi:hypothetical protein
MRERLGLIIRAWRSKEAFPVGPALLARAFDEAFSPVQVDQEIKQLLYRTFQEGVMPQLKNLYGSINKVLDDSKLFPPLEELLAQQSSPGARASEGVDQAAQQAPTAGDGEGGQGDAGGSLAPGNVAGRLERIAPGGRTTAASFYAGGPAAPTVDVFEAATTLLSLQRQSRRRLDARKSAEASPNTYTPSQVTEGLRELEQELGGAPIESSAIRDRLLAILRARVRDGESKRIADSQADAMDVVGNLVASIREDGLLTHGVKDLVKRLELTLYKLATLDPGFLKTQAGRPHPAMQMLNQLAKLGNAGDESEGIDREVGGQVDALMERVIDE